MTESSPQRVVVAIGGNAISQVGGDDSVPQDYANLRRSLASVVQLIERGIEVVLTHGNGPQVGNLMIRVEMARGQAPDLPLDVMVADLQGGLGYMIERVLRNKLLRKGIDKPVCVLLTLVEVDPKDAAFDNPTKFVGPLFQEGDVPMLVTERRWVMKEDRARKGYRRVVPSPQPRGIVEHGLIRTLIDSGALVVAGGGGGIPVARRKDGSLRGIEAVIDKDLTAAVLAREIDATELYILTAVEQVALHYGTPEEKLLGTLTVSEARAYMAAGHFPAGSMGPKMEAACRFVENGGERSLITDIYSLVRALDGETGTWIVPDQRSAAA